VANVHTLSDHIKVATSFNGVLANSTQAGTGVDTQGYRRAMAYVNVFTGAATTANFTISDSPDNSVWTVVTGATLAAAIVASTADTGGYLVNIDLAKRQRYLRVNIVGTGTAGNAVAGIILYEPMNAATTNVFPPLSV
jgi:hypothetical protein